MSKTKTLSSHPYKPHKKCSPIGPAFIAMVTPSAARYTGSKHGAGRRWTGLLRWSSGFILPACF